MRTLLDCTLLLVVAGVAVAQYDFDSAPSPPRVVIPGAVALGPAPGAARRLGGGRPQGRRQQQFQADPEPKVRARPPGRASRLPLPPTPISAGPQYFAPQPAPAIQQRPLLPLEDIAPRPVIEEAEDDYEEDSPSFTSFSPAPIAPSTAQPTPPPPPQRPAPSFRPESRPPVFRPERPALLPTPAPELNFVSPSRQQLRPTALPDEEDDIPRKSQYHRADQLYTQRNKVRPTAAPEEQQFSRQPQAQYNRAQAVVRAPQKQVYSNSKQQDLEKPLRQYQRPRKPVAQVLRRYREDNPDGSITWGFENDDGSFKEETIGTDCVTYGKYGYVDPDGTRREYSYSTGIPCDKEKDSQEQGSEGYIDYAENKYVLPNGDSIDLNKMVKNRARRPVANTQYRN